MHESSNRCNNLLSDNDLVFEEDTRLHNYQVKSFILAKHIWIEFIFEENSFVHML